MNHKPNPKPMPPQDVNINIGVLGHVDSGKTSLVRALSEKLSTAALDKHPQSRERGITLDLGFSAFEADVPPQLREKGVQRLQFTMVDCPGHASLIRTIIGGAQIIDRMLLVVDVSKGIQTQTAECLVIGEILMNDLIVVLNKVDIFETEEKRFEAIERVSKAIRQALAATRFKDAPIVPVSAIVGGDGKAGVGESASSATAQEVSSIGLGKLVDLLKATTELPDRGNVAEQPLYYAIDHCFPIKGQGTVVTGTVLGGEIHVGNSIEIPQLGLERKVKSMQMFKEPVQHASKGDRVAVCLANLDPTLLERGVLTTPGSVPSTSAVIALVRKVKYFPLECPSGSKLHVTVGHSTTLGTVHFFGSTELKEFAAEFVGKTLPSFVEYDMEQEFLQDDCLMGGGKAKGGPFLQWALLQFEQPIICQENAMLIGSRLDLNIDTKSCRIAFQGRITKRFPQKLTGLELHKIKVYKFKEREGSVDRVSSPLEVIGKGMFSKDTDMAKFVGLTISTEAKGGPKGVIESGFGKSGKYKVRFNQEVKLQKGDKLILRHKRYLFASSEEKKKVIQE